MADNNIIASQGMFWWDDAAVPEGFFVPDNAVSGNLTIAADGTSELELNGTLLSDAEHADNILLHNGLEIKRHIRGRLREDSSLVILRSIFSNGGSIGFRGLGSGNYSVYETLVGSKETAPLHDICAEELTICLHPVEKWTWCGAIELHRTEIEASVSYSRPSDYVYKTDNAILKLTHFLESTYPSSNQSYVYLKSQMYLEYKPNELRSPLEMQNIYRGAIDFLTVLLGYPVTLDWPMLKCGGQEFKYYFHRGIADPFETKRHDRWIRFDDIQARFGPLFFKWLSEREKFGPAFYLFLGYKRLRAMYAEHQFMNIAWAVESFSRIERLDASSADVQSRVDRIIESISEGSDKEWLAKRLRNAAEPNLEQRIFTVLTNLPFNINKSKMRKFATSCAELRNSISHFGGPRSDKETYQEFLVRLREHVKALDVLYHCRILKQIGLTDNEITRGAFTGLSSFYIRHHLAKVGLKEDDWDPAKCVQR